MVRARHEEIQKIERDFVELAQMFQDLDALVVQQEAAVTQIDEAGEEVLTNVNKANEEISGAIEKARSRNRKKWWCLLICRKFSNLSSEWHSVANGVCNSSHHHHYRGCGRRRCCRDQEVVFLRVWFYPPICTYWSSVFSSGLFGKGILENHGYLLFLFLSGRSFALSPGISTCTPWPLNKHNTRVSDPLISSYPPPFIPVQRPFE